MCIILMPGRCGSWQRLGSHWVTKVMPSRKVHFGMWSATISADWSGMATRAIFAFESLVRLMSRSRGKAMVRMPVARLATTEDLEQLLALFRASDVSAPVEPIERARNVWNQTIAQGGVTVFVSEVQTKIVATCMLVTAPNLLRKGRSHAFLENVVTHPAHQGQGHGRAVVEAALAQAWSSDCHHVLMQSGRTDLRVHSFYERCGFKPGLRTAFVAHRPQSPR